MQNIDNELQNIINHRNQSITIPEIGENGWICWLTHKDRLSIIIAIVYIFSHASTS
jgi:hypothetical protein